MGKDVRKPMPPGLEEAGEISEKVDPRDMQKSLDQLSKRNPAGYAQIVASPMGFVPSYVWDDKNDPWWSTPEAKEKLQQVRQACGEGPKPGKAIHMPPGAKYSYQGSLEEKVAKLKNTVNQWKEQGKRGPLMEKAEKYLAKYGYPKQ